MRVPLPPHSWNLSPSEAVAVQKALAERVAKKGKLEKPHLVAGLDVAFDKAEGRCIAAVVVWSLMEQGAIETATVRQKVEFPYIPGLLTFRELPALLAALEKLQHEPDFFICDGQGYAHPRRFGLACHLGVVLDRPVIGCAKSILVGEHAEPGPQRGSRAQLMHRSECVGLALRTRSNVKPVYVSVGHRLSLASAVRLVLACTTRYRLPEPTRLADRLAASMKIAR